MSCKRGICGIVGTEFHHPCFSKGSAFQEMKWRDPWRRLQQSWTMWQRPSTDSGKRTVAFHRASENGCLCTIAEVRFFILLKKRKHFFILFFHIFFYFFVRNLRYIDKDTKENIPWKYTSTQSRKNSKNTWTSFTQGAPIGKKIHNYEKLFPPITGALWPGFFLRSEEKKSI